MAGDDEVRAAADAMHEALGEFLHGRPAKFADLWLHDESVTYFHPFGRFLEGWTAIWQSVLADATVLTGGSILVDERIIHVFDDVAYSVGAERVEAIYAGERQAYRSQITDVYRRVGGRWLIVHHHRHVSSHL